MAPGRRRVAAALAVLVLTLGACSDDDGDLTADTPPADTNAPTTSSPNATTTTSTTTTMPVAPTGPTTTLPTVTPTGDLRLLDDAMDPDGTLSLEGALALFAAGYSPIDVEPAPDPLIDGTPVLRTLLGRLDELTQEQREAVLAVTDRIGVPLAAAPDDPRLDAAGDTIRLGRAIFSNLLGRDLRPGVMITVVPLPYFDGDTGRTNFSSPASFAEALPFAVADGTTYDECRIRINTEAPVDPDRQFEDPAFISAVASSAFRCLQYGLVGPGAGVPLWVMEGAAAFAGEEYVQGSSRSADWWARWIGEPLRPLERRTYDAAGFFALLKGYVDGVFKYTDIFLADAEVTSLVRRLELTRVFDRWGTQFATEPAWGADYTVPGFGAPATRAPSLPVTLEVDGPPVTVTNPGPILVGAGYRLTVPGEILVVSTDPGDNGGLRFGDGTAASFDGATQAYCLTPGECACPGATPGESSATDVASTGLFLGVGPSPGGGPTLSARSLLQWCNEVALPAPPTEAFDQCLAERWTSTGYEAPDPPGVRQEITGGAGAVLDLRPDRTVTVDMNATTPVVFTSQDAEGELTTTTLQYRGSGTGTWSAADGVVAVNGVDPSSFTVRLRIEMPGGQLTDVTLPATDTRLARFAGLLGTGRYVCSAAAMTLTHVTPGVGGESGFSFIPA